MIEFNFVIFQMPTTVLASIIVTPYNAHFCCEANLAPSNPALLLRLRCRLSSKKDRTNMSEHIATSILESSRNTFWVFSGVKFRYLFFEESTPHGVKRTTSVVISLLDCISVTRPFFVRNSL